MAWLAVNIDGTERISQDKPYRLGDFWQEDYDLVDIPYGSIQKLIGRTLTWEDEPVELK